MSATRLAGVVVTVPPAVSFETLAVVVERLARRDPDRTDVSAGAGGGPSFASWTAAGGEDIEVDYHDDAAAGIRWLEVRGEQAAERAGEIAAMLGGQCKGTVEDALVDLMTPRRRPEDEKPDAAGAIRWRALRQALATAGPANMAIIVPMVRAGLRDPDWRVRMTAMLAVGKLRLTAQAEGAMAAKVPPAGESGLGSEDRRALLALRQAAHDRALGLPPSTGPGEGMPADIAAKRRAYQQHLHALLAGAAVEVAVTDTAALVMAALLENGRLRNAIYPGRWRAWLDRSHG